MYIPARASKHNRSFPPFCCPPIQNQQDRNNHNHFEIHLSPVQIIASASPESFQPIFLFCSLVGFATLLWFYNQP